MPMPWRIAAGRIASPASTSNERPLGWAVTLKGPGVAEGLVIFSVSSEAVVEREQSILPSIQSPLGALPSRFRRERVLIIGCGDVGLRIARRLSGRVVLRALTSSPGRVEALRAAGIVPL